MNIMDNATRLQEWKEKLVGRLVVEGARDLSNDELVRCFQHCVSARCLPIARLLRRHHLLTLDDLRIERELVPGK